MRRFPARDVSRSARGLALLGLVALLAGWLGLLTPGAPVTASTGTTASAGRVIYLPLVRNGAATSPTPSDSGLSYSLSLSPARQVAPGSLLRATITAHNKGNESYNFRNLTLRFRFAQVGFERAEGDNVVVVGESGDYVTAAFRRIEPQASVSGTLLFRVRDSLAAGTAIAIEPEYTCGSRICKTNLAQVQVGGGSSTSQSVDDTQELLVAPASGGADTVFRFSSRKFAHLDTVELWLSGGSGGVRRLPQSYRVGSDGWVRFELRGSTFGPGRWNLLAYGSISGFSSTVSFTVGGAAALGDAQAARVGTSLLSHALPAIEGAAISAAPAPAQATGTGGMAGRVTDGATGTGVADVLVVARLDGAPVASALTGTDGAYLIPVGLPTGTYEVRALPASAGGATGYQDAARSAVAVTSPELTRGVDFALVAGGAIGGRVMASDTRRGLGGVAVEVLAEGGAVAGSGATAADGSYTVEGLPEGIYSVRLSTETGDDGDVATYAGTTIADVAVTAGATVFADAGLALRESVAAIRGRVSGAAGGLPGVFVAVFDGDAELVDLTETEADGSYATGPLAAGSYRLAFVTFFADSATTRRHISAFYQGGGTFATATPVEVAATGVVKDINITLALGGSIGGKITGAGGAALADVLVAAFDAGGQVRAVGRSGADGAYSLPGLAAGAYRVGYFAEYAAGAEVRRYQDSYHSGKGSLGEADALNVGAGQVVSGIDATLSLGGAISGRVTADGVGAGLEGVVVIAFDGSGGIGGVAQSDEEGAYSIVGLAPGSYTVLFDTILAPVEAARGYLDEYFDDRSAAPYTAVTVATGGTATASAGLARGGQIAGRVTASDSGLGLGGVAVLVYSGDTLASFAMSDASGAYTTAGLRAGSYTLRFEPGLSTDQDVQQYVAQTRAGAVAVTVGAVSPDADIALARP